MLPLKYGPEAGSLHSGGQLQMDQSLNPLVVTVRHIFGFDNTSKDTLEQVPKNFEDALMKNSSHKNQDH